jgi:hypothetical protein
MKKQNRRAFYKCLLYMVFAHIHSYMGLFLRKDSPSQYKLYFNSVVIRVGTEYEKLY